MKPDTRPLLIAHDAVDQFKSAQQMTPSAGIFVDVLGSAANRPYEVRDGMAVLSVNGPLFHKERFFGSYYTGLASIEARLQVAELDEEVKGVALDMDSPGGDVSGTFEAAAAVANFSKPIWAIVDSTSASAAYAIAASADRIVLPATGQVGSIGVVTSHTDVSGALEDAGVRKTFIYAGKHKVDGNPFGPLSAEALANIQDSIDSLYQIFVNHVASGRGLTPEAVAATEARMYLGADAVEAGLADAVMSPSEAYAAFAAVLNDGHSLTDQIKGNLMTDSTNTAAESVDTFTAADVDAAKASAAQEASAAATQSERQRISAILGAEEAQGRQELANHLAMETDQSVEAALALLAKAPVAATAEAPAPKAGNAFESAMDNSENPDVGDGEDLPAAEETDPLLAAFDRFKTA